MILKNKAAGPRIFNVQGGAPGVVIQRTLLPGEVADLELLAEPDKDPVLKAMLDGGELEEADAKALETPVAMDPAEVLKKQAEAQTAVAEAQAARAELHAAELDLARRTPPRQFAGDGGPHQLPTVSGHTGAPTPAQVEAGRKDAAPAVAAVTMPPAQAAPQPVPAGAAHKPAGKK